MQRPFFSIVNHGIDHPQYFPGISTVGTPYTHVTTGIGDNASEAYHDAIEQLYQVHESTQVEWLRLPTRPGGIRARDRVPRNAEECYWYVSILYALAPERKQRDASTVEADFWSHVKKGETCWEWQGSRSLGKRPYGKTYYEGKYQYTHRVAWQLAKGPIPPGMHVLHQCDNPPCCNPSHLFIGTQRDNLRDASHKGRLTGNHGMQGEAHPRAKLTWELVRTIRDMYASGTSHKAIASMVGMAHSTIWSVVSGQTWKE